MKLLKAYKMDIKNSVVYKIVLLLGIFSFSEAITTITKGETNTVKVSVYYESLCPGSKEFITIQLFPNYESLKDSITVDWVPYGHANQTEANGQWTFKCQHGVRECKGNMYQACALDQKRGQTDNAKFVNCVMALKDSSNSTGIKYCARNFGFNWSLLKECVYTDKGSELLAYLGNRTHSLNSDLKYVPTVIYNDVYNEELCDESLEDFLGTACSQIPQPKPAACNK